MPVGAGELVWYSRTRSRTRPRTVFRTSLAVRWAAKLNQFARALPFVNVVGDVGGLGGGDCVEDVAGDGVGGFVSR